MLLDNIHKILSNNYDFELTNDQNLALSKLTDFVLNKNKNQIFILKGYAGTGKTTIISSLIAGCKTVGINTVLLAPTGRAAKVLTSYAKTSAFTIHKYIFKFLNEDKKGYAKFVLDKNKTKNTIFVVDEASMISNLSVDKVFGSGNLLKDLTDYVFSGKNCKLLLVGDVAQLPPVGFQESPALDETELKLMGYDTESAYLRTVVRQALKSGILFNATQTRKLIDNFVTGIFPQITTDFADVERIRGAELIDKISIAYDKHGIEDTIIVTRSNWRANKYNEGIRRSILWRDSKIEVDDFIMIVRNNYFWAQDYDGIDFIANGDVARIVRINKFEEMYGFKFVDATIQLIDYDDIEIDAKLLLDTLYINKASMDFETLRLLYDKVAEDYPDDYPAERNRKIRQNPYFNALQIKFAYAITCHKAQGGQWRTVFIDHGVIEQENMTVDFARWLYTAITRATEKLYFVNFRNEFFERT